MWRSGALIVLCGLFVLSCGGEAPPAARVLNVEEDRHEQ